MAHLPTEPEHGAEPVRWDHTAMEAMRAHAAREAPREACGALVGRQGVIVEAVPMTNTEASLHHYSIDVQETLALFERLDREAGSMEVLGWYHSHPHGSSRPSDADLDLAVPGYYYVIVGQDGETTFSL